MNIFQFSKFYLSPFVEEWVSVKELVTLNTSCTNCKMRENLTSLFKISTVVQAQEHPEKLKIFEITTFFGIRNKLFPKMCWF
jgi:hypothetical protein